MRVRREFRLLAAETASVGHSEPFSLNMLTHILREDPAYREYMLWMGIFGGGNLMLTAQLVLVFSEQLHLTSATQIGLLAVVPLITQPLFLPWWARLFDGSHVVRYRSRQGWAIVLASAAMCAGVFAGSLGPYGVSKHAVTALTETVYFNLKSQGVTHVGVSVLCPSAVRTNFGTSDRNRPAWAGASKIADEEAQASAERFNELSKLGSSPAEVAERVVAGIRSRRFYILTADNRHEPIIRRGQEIPAGGPPAAPVNFV